MPDVPKIAPDVVPIETAPTQAPTLFSPRKSPLIHSDDYDLRSPDEIAAPVSRAQDPHVSPSRKRRWLLILGAGVAAVVVVGLSIVLAWPQLPFRDNRPPQFRFTSVPEGANIVVNGVDTGLRTPAEVPLAQLPASIRLVLGGYEPFVTQVSEEAARKTDRWSGRAWWNCPRPHPRRSSPRRSHPHRSSLHRRLRLRRDR